MIWTSALANGNSSGCADTIHTITKQYFLPSDGRNSTTFVCHQVLGSVGLSGLPWHTLVFPVRKFSDKQHIFILLTKLFGPYTGVVWFRDFQYIYFVWMTLLVRWHEKPCVDTIWVQELGTSHIPVVLFLAPLDFQFSKFGGVAYFWNCEWESLDRSNGTSIFPVQIRVNIFVQIFF